MCKVSGIRLHLQPITLHKNCSQFCSLNMNFHLYLWFSLEYSIVPRDIVCRKLGPFECYLLFQLWTPTAYLRYPSRILYLASENTQIIPGYTAAHPIQLAVASLMGDALLRNRHPISEACMLIYRPVPDLNPTLGNLSLLISFSLRIRKIKYELS